MEALPMIVFITNKNCGHCNILRGNDGKPKDSNPKWNNDYIKSLLTYPELNNKSDSKQKTNGRPKRLQASCIVEINVATSGRNLDNIAEINIYSIIPSIVEIERYISSNVRDYKFFDASKIPGSAVERINIKRERLNNISIEVEVDGIFSPHLTEFYTNEYIWKQVPPQIEILREYLITDTIVPIELLNEIGNPNITEYVIEYKDNGVNNIQHFDDQIKSHFYNFPWLLSKIVPIRIRDYEDYYPIWMLVSPNEWKHSLHTGSSIFSNVTNHETTWNGSKYEITPYTRGEKIEDLLEKYRNKQISLHYVEKTKPKHKFTWSS